MISFPFPIAAPAMAPTRRSLLKAGVAGLLLGFVWTPGGRVARGQTPAQNGQTSAPMPNAFVRIGTDDSVTVIAKHLEMGQGAYTGLATIVAEELDADWATVKVEAAPADAARYNNLAFGPVQGTGGSSSIANSYEQLRRAGAAARAMLVASAAEAWSVPTAEITVARGVVAHAGSGRQARFGELAERAARQPVPAQVTLKDPSRFTLIGSTGLRRVDRIEKTTGRAIYAIDVTLPGMLVAVVQRPPKFGARVRSFDATQAKAVAGVVDVVQIPRGIAVLAQGMWAATKGREALQVEWDFAAAETRDTGAIVEAYRTLLAQPGLPARREGDAERALAGATRRLEAQFVFPYLAHAPMEPLTCVVRLTADACEIWAGDQFQTIDQANAARIAGLRPDQVAIHTVYAGGSFGRRANAESDYIVEAVSIAKAIGGRAPVKLIWTREDDIKGGRYRPLYVHSLAAGLDAGRNPVAWRHRIAGQSIIAGTPFAAMIQNGIDGTSVEGAANLPYAIPNLAVELHTTQSPVPVLWWRSVGSTHTAFATEVFLDELAEAAGQDAVAFRRALLAHHPRHRAVLDLAAEKAGWGAELPQGKGRGIAVHESFNSFVAQVAEVTVGGDGSLKVDRVVCAVDCGLAINPDVIAAQMEGGIGYGLSAALGEAITLKDGEVEQSNFHDYTPLRIDAMPKVEVHIVPSREPPTGVGEPGVPPAAPAVANAIYRATGRRLRTLPLNTGGLRTN